MATSNEWQQIYYNNLTGPPQPTMLRWPSDAVTDATTITTTATISTAASSISNHLSRVARPANTRRRTRASRKTPITLLNTDTTNFRAMVQQFTGGSSFVGVGGGGGDDSTAFMAASATVAPRQPLSNYNSTISSSGVSYYGTGSRISPPASGGYNVEFRQPMQQQYYSVVADNSGDGGDHQYGFVQTVQDGGFNFSGEW